MTDTVDDTAAADLEALAADEVMLKAINKLAIPTFENVEDERRHRKERLAAAFRLLGRRGLTTGVAGHITVRDPEHPDLFWVNPFTQDFTKMRVSDLVLMNEEGNLIEGEEVVNGAAFAIHSAIHKVNPQVTAACHSHAPWARPFSAFGRMIEPTSQDACAFYEAQALVSEFTGVVLGDDVSMLLANAFLQETGGPAGITTAIHQNHGHITVGETVDEAVFWFIMFEQMCESQMRIEATGKPYHVIPHEVAQHTAKTVGSHFAGYVSCQGMMNAIIEDEPDLLN